MPVTYASGSQKGSDVLLAIKQRLVEGLASNDPDTDIDDSFVRIVARPGPSYAFYRAETGIALLFSPPQPFTPSGAGRSGLKVTRQLEVHVVSLSMVDAAHEDEKAVLAHIDLEERIADVLIDASPVPTATKIAIKVRWLPGGADIERQIKKDQGQIISVLLFEVEYAAYLQVNRD